MDRSMYNTGSACQVKNLDKKLYQSQTFPKNTNSEEQCKKKKKKSFFVKYSRLFPSLPQIKEVGLLWIKMPTAEKNNTFTQLYKHLRNNL